MPASYIISFLLSSSKSIEKWHSLQNHPEFFNELETVLSFLLQHSKNGGQYLDYLLAIEIDQLNEDQLTSYYELLILETNYREMNEDWFCTLITNNIANEKSEIVLENIVIFLGEQHQKYHFSPQDRLIQQLSNIIENLMFNNMFKLFLFENSLEKFSENDILQLFDSLSKHELRLDLLSIVNNGSHDLRTGLLKGLIQRVKDKQYPEAYTNLIIFLNGLDIVQELFSEYEAFFSLINSFQSKDFLEPLIYEIVKPKWLINPWIVKLIAYYLEIENTDVLVIKASGEYIADYPDHLIKSIVKTSKSPKKETREELTGIISEKWINEELILNLLKDTEETVKSSLFQVIIPIFPSLSFTVKDKIKKSFSKPEYQIQAGYLLGYHFNNPTINKNNLKKVFETSSEDQQSGIVLGLGMRWSSLTTGYRKFLTTILNDKKAHQKVKRYLCNGLESFIGLMDKEGLELLEKGRKLNYSRMNKTEKVDTNDVVLL